MSEDIHMGLPLEIGQEVPNVDLPTLVDGKFENLNTKEEFAGKRVILFSLPGAFTPTCSNNQLPGFEEKFAEFQEKEIGRASCRERV